MKEFVLGLERPAREVPCFFVLIEAEPVFVRAFGEQEVIGSVYVKPDVATNVEKSSCLR